MVSEFQGTAAQELIKNLILSFSGAGIGLALYLAAVNIKGVFRTHRWERRLHLAYACARIGSVGAILLVAEAVFRAPRPIPVNIRTILYTLFILMFAAGYAGIFWEKRHARKIGVHGGPDEGDL